MRVRPVKEGKLEANGAVIVEPKVVVPNGLLVVLDNYLFPDEQVLKKNATQGKLDIGMLSVVTAKEEAKTLATNTTFIDNIIQVLSFLKSGVRVFQHFLTRSNVSQLLTEGAFNEILPFIYFFKLYFFFRRRLHGICADGPRFPKMAPDRLGFLSVQRAGIHGERDN